MDRLWHNKAPHPPTKEQDTQTERGSLNSSNFVSLCSCFVSLCGCVVSFCSYSFAGLCNFCFFTSLCSHFYYFFIFFICLRLYVFILCLFLVILHFFVVDLNLFVADLRFLVVILSSLCILACHFVSLVVVLHLYDHTYHLLTLSRGSQSDSRKGPCHPWSPRGTFPAGQNCSQVRQSNSGYRH